MHLAAEPVAAHRLEHLRNTLVPQGLEDGGLTFEHLERLPILGLRRIEDLEGNLTPTGRVLGQIGPRKGALTQAAYHIVAVGKPSWPVSHDKIGFRVAGHREDRGPTGRSRTSLQDRAGPDRQSTCPGWLMPDRSAPARAPRAPSWSVRAGCTASERRQPRLPANHGERLRRRCTRS